jgi:hypothetical protein
MYSKHIAASWAFTSLKWAFDCTCNVITAALRLAQYLTSKNVLQLYERKHTINYDKLSLTQVRL